MELVVTVLTQDRPGVIERVSGVIARHGGSWQDSRMAQLAGTFAGIIAVDVPDPAGEALRAELLALTGIVVHATAAAQPLPPTQHHRLDVVANDRPGIVAEVSAALAAMEVNVAELQTSVEPASMSGGVVFRARLDLGLASDQQLADVVARLEELSADLMIDVAEG